MEVAVCPANPPRQVKVESETAFRTMLYARSSQYPNRLLTSLFLFELPSPLLPEMPFRLLSGRRYRKAHRHYDLLHFVNKRIIPITGQSLPILRCGRESQTSGPAYLESCINPGLAPISRAEPEHALARRLEGQELRLKNNKPPL